MPKSPDAFRTISEVADWLGVQAHVLRFWESKFSQVKPIKRAGGRRYYRPADMLLLGGIKQLLHEDGLTIKGAQKLLRENGVPYVADMSQPLDDLTIAVIEGSTAGSDDEVSDLQEAVVPDAMPEESPAAPAAQVLDEPPAPVTPEAPAMPEPEVLASTPTEPEVIASTPEPDLSTQTPDTAPLVAGEPDPEPVPQAAVEPEDAPDVLAPSETAQTAPPAEQDDVPAPREPEPAPQEIEPAPQEPEPAPQEPEPAPQEPEPSAITPMADEPVAAETVPSDPASAEPEQPQTSQDAAQAMPSFRARPRSADAEAIVPTDPTPAPAAPQETPTPPQAEPTVQDSAAPVSPPETSNEAPKPRVVDLPPVPAISQIAVDPSALSALTQVKSLTPAQAQEIKPLLARLTRLRASMATPRKEIHKD
ncbi:MerR family transcriptional regulator [Roseobacter litoralis]|uniref:MerR family transcriptional regulator n=1 Tax=Roseobacter litoralis TaxID=42443 RepID=UPI002494D39C|nr:MerR family transcriptional regulator [Roseobacter litoralis]